MILSFSILKSSLYLRESLNKLMEQPMEYLFPIFLAQAQF